MKTTKKNNKSVNKRNTQTSTATPPVAPAAPADTAIVSSIRPGISDAMLQRAGIVHIDAKTAFERTDKPYAGLWIPYRNLDGTDMVYGNPPKPMGRIRMDVPNKKQKYHQEWDSSYRCYFTPGLLEFPKGTPMYLIEGEFKAMALVEAGYLAIGLGGVYGFGREKSTVLLDDLKVAFAHFQPESVYFVGDSDMCTNYQFADAAMKLHNLIK
ncbi:MAG: DUF3854 domain-containing protein [Verrucomicrobiota bacterium]